MSIAKNIIDEHEERLAVITAIGIEVRALVIDPDADELTPTGDPGADRLLYAKAFQAWADGKIAGEPEDIFETVQEALEI
jgi:hypothetical protein